MADVIDIKLTQTGNIWDIGFLSNGDLETVSGFETSLTMSLFTDARATSSEVSIPERRRGWLGDELFDGFQHGSKLWLLDQARINFNTRNLAITYANNALQWLIDDSYLSNIQTTATITSTNVKLTIVGIMLDQSKNTYAYNLWTNTQGLT